MSEASPHKGSKSHRKSKRRSSASRHAQPLPSSTTGAGVDTNGTPNAQASSSKLPPTSTEGSGEPGMSIKESKKARREARKAAKLLANPIHPALVDGGDGRRDKGKAPDRLPGSQADGWEAVPLAQAPAANIPHVWSRDGRFFFTVTGSSINVHSGTHPFARLSTLSAFGTPDSHAKPITALLAHPSNSMQLLSASEDSSIRVWDWVEGRFVRSYILDGHVGGMCLGKMDGSWSAFAFITKPKSDSSHSIVQVRLSAGKDKAIRTLRSISTPPTSIIISPSSTYLVVLAKHKAYAFDLTNRPDGRPKQVKFASDQILTCGAFAPADAMGDREEWFATGDVKGVIRLWHGLSSAFRQAGAVAGKEKDADRRLPTTSMHWHAHGVSALAFTSSGAQLLSVGEESVLVQWHLASGRREYVPRLGGKPLQSLSVRGSDKAREEEWWMMMSDGASVKVGASSGKIQTIGQSVRFDPLQATSEKPYPIALHPSSSALVLPSSHPSTLQWVDPSTVNVLFDLEVAPSNRVSRRDKEVVPVTVNHVEFSDLSSSRVKWMATLETRESDLGEGGGGVSNLKFWIWHNQKYVVNTQFPRPHSSSDITSLSFSSTPTLGDPQKNDPYLLTTSSDGIAKLWQVRTARKSEQGKSATKKTQGLEQFWAQRSTFNYRDMSITSGTFSPDGTIVALCHGGVVSLWDTESNVLLRALATPKECKLAKVAFVGKDGRHLVGAGEGGLAVWDMLSCDLAWSTNQSIEDLVTLPSSSHFLTVALASTAGISQIHLHSPVSSAPLRTETCAAVIKRLLPLPSSFADPLAHLECIALTSTSQVVRLGDRVTATTAPSTSVQVAEKKSTSVWQEMFGKEAFLEPLAPPPPSSASIARKSGRPEDVFEGPSHTLPSTTLLFDSFIEGVLSSSSRQAVAEDVEMMADVEIQYQEPKEPAVEVVRPAVKVREVTDQDVSSLEAFFREVLSVPAVSAATPRAKVNGILNGHAHAISDDSSDSDSSDEELPTPKSPKASPKMVAKKLAVQKARRQSNGSASEREEVVHAVKGKGMKRKA